MTGSNPRARKRVSARELRLGVYVDLHWCREGEVVSTDFAFAEFIGGLVDRVGEVVVFGRLDPEPGREPYALPAGVRFVALPHYRNVTDVVGMIRSLRGARAVFAREFSGLDAVWLFGPHPVSLALAPLARRAGVPVFLGVREDFPRYVAGRLPSRGWAWAVPAAHLLERAWRRLARTTPTVTVGEALARRYRSRDATVLAAGVSLVSAGDLVSREAALARSWDGPLELLSVGRIEPEKNPLLLVEVLARLPERWRLTAVGTGSLREELERRLSQAGLSARAELPGYIPWGSALRDRYRSAHALVNVSDTEGVPQIVFEAHASGLPIVATDVGGVRAALRDGASGLLVPRRDAGAVADALEQLAAEPELRWRLVEAGLEQAEGETLEAQLARIVAFFEDELR
jgi:glycosyltransferase involved in cell wall biosynthesis